MAATTVTGDLYREIDGKLEEVKRQLRQKGGYPFDPLKLQKGLQALIEGRFPGDLTSVFSRDMTTEGWKLVEDVEKLQIGELLKLEFASILKQGENSISGNEMMRRAKELGCNLGQLDAEYLLAHPGRIPVRPEGVYWILFPGTVWRSRGGDLNVPCLHWAGVRWRLSFTWLGRGWSSLDGFLRPCK